MHWPRAILIGVILSLLAGANIDARAADQLDLAAFRTAALKQHNVYRARHGVPPLVLSSQLNDVAQRYAEQLARTNQLVHSDNTRFGENLYTFSSSDQALPRPAAVVDRWYSEIQNVTVQVVQVMLRRASLLRSQCDEEGVRVQAAPCTPPDMPRSYTPGHCDVAA